jgi:hypothetical protein
MAAAFSRMGRQRRKRMQENNELWIADSGSGTKSVNVTVEESVIRIYVEQVDETEKSIDLPQGDYICLSYYTDEFKAQRVRNTAEQALIKDIDKLLEIRIFNADREFLARRSNVGGGFSWRLTDDKSLDDKANGTKPFYDSYQDLDINDDKLEEDGQTGQVDLYTTVGGKYSLPSDILYDEKSVNCKARATKIKLRNYLKYDNIGMATVVDTRMCGFVEKQEENL